MGPAYIRGRRLFEEIRYIDEDQEIQVSYGIPGCKYVHVQKVKY